MTEVAGLKVSIPDYEKLDAVTLTSTASVVFLFSSGHTVSRQYETQGDAHQEYTAHAVSFEQNRRWK